MKEKSMKNNSIKIKRYQNMIDFFFINQNVPSGIFFTLLISFISFDNIIFS